MISCRDATELAIKKNLDKLSYMDRIRLRFHLLMCRFCRFFEKQNNIIDEASSHLDEVTPTHMTDLSKKKILDKILK